MKVALVGGGGFRAPLVVGSLAGLPRDAAVEEVVLADTDPHRLGVVAAVVEAMGRGWERRPEVRTTTDLDGAVDGAGAVLVAIRVGGLPGRVVDETVPLAHGVLGQETVGPGGICFALRTIPTMLAIARTVADRAPGAWLVNFTNPAGTVTEAVRAVLGDRVVGVCDSPAALCARVATALGRRAEDLRFGYAGLNHLGWLTSVTQADGDGGDLLPALIADDHALSTVDEARLFGAGHLRDRGAIPNEYLLYLRRTEAIVRVLRRDGSRAELLARQQGAFYERSYEGPEEALAAWRAARDARFGTYLAEGWSVAEGPAPDGEVAPTMEGPGEAGSRAEGPGAEGPGEAGYGAIAAAFLRAVTTGRPDRLILDVANAGAIAWLDDDAVVEVPCLVDADGPRSDGPGTLGDEERALVERMKDVERLTIDAAIGGSLDLATEAIAAHPVVGSRDLAQRIVGGYLERHAWMRERFR